MVDQRLPRGDYEILALDVGERRIGVARAQSRARLVEPLEVMAAGRGVEFERLAQLLSYWQPALIVVGLPLDKDGSVGQQAVIIRNWVQKMLAKTGFKGRIVYQDETLSTHQARQEAVVKGPVDDLAAGILLEDYLN